MNFSGWLARFRRLQDEHATWKLLHADNAPVILAFIANLFAEENEVPFARARIALDAELARGRELGYWQSESGAGIYLNQWIRAGWLREMDDMLPNGHLKTRFSTNSVSLILQTPILR